MEQNPNSAPNQPAEVRRFPRFIAALAAAATIAGFIWCAIILVETNRLMRQTEQQVRGFEVFLDQVDATVIEVEVEANQRMLPVERCNRPAHAANFSHTLQTRVRTPRTR